MKYPVLIPYKSSTDNGEELRHSLRSLKNITNWNGKVYIAGDKEDWFSDRINFHQSKRVFGKPYYDQIEKMVLAVQDLPDKFIVSMDDIYITSPTEIGYYFIGTLEEKTGSFHTKSKNKTLEYLISQGEEEPNDFEAHAPMLVDKENFIKVLSEIRSNKDRALLQWRSIYGNKYADKIEFFVDNKTRDEKLPNGNIISTSYFTDELTKLFPRKSRFEK